MKVTLGNEKKRIPEYRSQLKNSQIGAGRFKGQLSAGASRFYVGDVAQQLGSLGACNRLDEYVVRVQKDIHIVSN